MIRDRVIKDFDGLIDWLKGKTVNSMGKVNFNISQDSHREIILRLERMRNLVAEPVATSYCHYPKRHAPGCQCMGI